ncbi:MAG: hypothetical protein HYY06_17785 [Deltaproteobacteria bacterium]|nr:hypothetical protein [Deltaproteobacteria bacterium]
MRRWPHMGSTFMALWAVAGGAAVGLGLARLSAELVLKAMPRRKRVK